MTDKQKERLQKLAAVLRAMSAGGTGAYWALLPHVAVAPKELANLTTDALDTVYFRATETGQRLLEAAAVRATEQGKDRLWPRYPNLCQGLKRAAERAGVDLGKPSELAEEVAGLLWNLEQGE